MTQPDVQSQVQDAAAIESNKEMNFRRQEVMYQRMLAEKEARIAELQAAQQKPVIHEEDDEIESEPYVDHKKLKKEQAKLNQRIKQETQTDIQRAVQTAIMEERKQAWLKDHKDFYDILKLSDAFAEKEPELADNLLEMPEGFERSKLVYQNIKSLGLHKPAAPISTIQEKVDANRRAPFYQPSGVGTAPYASASDFSPAGQKNAHAKMQELKNRLRLG